MTKSLFILLQFISICIIGQNDDVYKTFIQNSSHTIAKAQKTLIHFEKSDGNGDLLAKSIILQNHAIALYNAKNYTRAVCASAVARNYAVEFIKNTYSSVNPSYVLNQAYLINDDEKKLLSHCSSDDMLYIESKAFANNPSELNKDYLNSLNNLIIEFN